MIPRSGGAIYPAILLGSVTCTPLTSIRASLGLIVDGAVGDVPEKTMDLTKIAETNKLRLLPLVNDIFYMEKIEAGQFGYAFEPIDLSELLPKAIKANEAYGIEFRDDFFNSSHSSRVPW
ncbi:MAG: hypothetical protein VX955_16065 [Pseudomonadota bacterium]|nr:hypothetical protein [Pseudomonadota bacterium]